MEKNIKYKQKYLKYKQKYLLEKNQLYGGSTAATTVAIHNFQQQLANQKNIIDAGRAQASNPRVDSIFQQLETDVISTLDNFKQTLNNQFHTLHEEWLKSLELTKLREVIQNLQSNNDETATNTLIELETERVGVDHLDQVRIHNAELIATAQRLQKDFKNNPIFHANLEKQYPLLVESIEITINGLDINPYAREAIQSAALQQIYAFLSFLTVALYEEQLRQLPTAHAWHHTGKVLDYNKFMSLCQDVWERLAEKHNLSVEQSVQAKLDGK
tara:strand:+ start:3128 stop:3943 length:816 start_codon:yes stop_codon:yes gene_type:complete